MLEVIVQFDPTTGRIAVNSPLSPAVAALLLKLGIDAATQQAMLQLHAEAGRGIQRPTCDQVKLLVDG
jgi:hypothetical protein